MDGRGSKLCRTPSSLLRLPISSASAAAVTAAAAGGDNDNDNKKALHPRRPPPNRRSLPLPLPLPLLILSAAAFLLLLLFHAASPPLAALILLSAAAAHLLRRHPHRPTPPVHWFIGDDLSPPNFPFRASAGHIGVELYANGDFYEGEFYRCRCSGSGVYSFLASKGRYEGDWVEGKYDGYGARAGRGAAGTAASISPVCGMDSVSTGSTARTATPASGPAGKATGLGCRLAPMAAAMPASSAGGQARPRLLPFQTCLSNINGVP